MPFQEQDAVLSNETKPQSIISCPFSSCHKMVTLASQNEDTNVGNADLIWASSNGDDNFVEKLLAAGADPNRQDEVRKLVTRVMLIHVPNSFVPNKVLHLFLGQ